MGLPCPVSIFYSLLWLFILASGMIPFWLDFPLFFLCDHYHGLPLCLLSYDNFVLLPGILLLLWICYLYIFSMHHVFKVTLFLDYYIVLLTYRLNPLDPLWIYPWICTISESVGLCVNWNVFTYMNFTIWVTTKALHQSWISSQCS